MRRALTAACIACLLLSTGILQAQEPLSARLPKDSLLYVGWAGKTKAFDGSKLGQLLQEPGLTRMWGLIREAAMRAGGGEGPQAQLIQDAWALGETALSHPGAIALVDFKMDKGEPLPSAALLLDLGADREKFAQRLEGVLRTVGMLEDAPKDGKLPTIPTPAGPLALGYIGNVFYAALGEGLPAILEAATKDNSLAASPAFAEAMKAVGGGELQVAFYLDAAAVLKRVEPLVEGDRPASAGDKKPKFGQILESLGVAKVKYLAAALSAAEGGLLNTKLRIASPAPHRGVLLPLAGAGLTEADLAHLPADTDFLAAWKASAEDLLAEARRILKELAPEVDADLAQELAKPDSPVKIVCQDLFASLGQTWTFSVASSYAGPLAGMLLTAEVKDAAKFKDAAEKLETFLNAAADPMAAMLSDGGPGDRPRRAGVEKLQAGGVEIRYFHMSRREPIPVAPAWALHKGRLYVALWPQVIQSAIENQGKDSLVKSAGFASLRARLGANPCVLTYANTPRIVRGVYPFALLGWTMGSGMLAREGLAARPDWLPPLSAIEKHLSPEIGAVWADKDGITLEGYGSLPGLSSAPLLPAIGVAMAGYMISGGASADAGPAGPTELRYWCDPNSTPKGCGNEFVVRVKDLPHARNLGDELDVMKLDCPKCKGKKTSWQERECPNCKKWFVPLSTRLHYEALRMGRGDPTGVHDVCPWCKTDLQKWYIEHQPKD